MSRVECPTCNGHGCEYDVRGYPWNCHTCGTTGSVSKKTRADVLAWHAKKKKDDRKKIVLRT